MPRLCAVLALSLSVVLSLAEYGPILAQTAKPAAKPAKTPTAAGPIVNNLGATLLVRTLLVALHHAAVTGNYTVLRDLGDPKFRVTNTPMSLAEAMKSLRAKNFRLDLASLATPVLLMPPHRDQKGRLRLYGYMPTEPEQFLFDLRYLHLNKRWLIEGLRINFGKVPPKVAEAAAKSAQMTKHKARPQVSAKPAANVTSSSNKGVATANEAPSDLKVEPNALAEFGRHLQSHGVISSKASPPKKTKVKAPERAASKPPQAQPVARTGYKETGRRQTADTPAEPLPWKPTPKSSAPAP